MQWCEPNPKLRCWCASPRSSENSSGAANLAGSRFAASISRTTRDVTTAAAGQQADQPFGQCLHRRLEPAQLLAGGIDAAANSRRILECATTMQETGRFADNRKHRHRIRACDAAWPGSPP